MNAILEQSDSQRRWAGTVHLAAMLTALLTSWMVGFGGMLAAIIVWFLVRDERDPFAQSHAAEAFNFNFSMCVYTIVATVVGGLIAGLITLVTLGMGLIVVIPVAIAIIAAAAIVWTYCSVCAAIAGYQGKPYTYPLTFDLLR